MVIQQQFDGVRRPRWSFLACSYFSYFFTDNFDAKENRNEIDDFLCHIIDAKSLWTCRETIVLSGLPTLYAKKRLLFHEFFW